MTAQQFILVEIISRIYRIKNRSSALRRKACSLTLRLYAGAVYCDLIILRTYSLYDRSVFRIHFFKCFYNRVCRCGGHEGYRYVDD